jgi:NDP-sugar pyrophosphorylase family protein
VKLHYVEEPVILGTSGAVDNARDFFLDETFVVVNGKIITDLNLGDALRTHRNTGALATLVLLPNTHRERFTVVKTNDGLLDCFGGMPKPNDEEPLMFTGIQIFEPGILDYIPRGVFSHSTTDVFPKIIADGKRIAVHIASGKWRELSTLQRYLDISIELMREVGHTMTVGTSCTIEDDVDIREAILWDRVTVEAGARVHRSVLADGVRVKSHDVVENAVVVPAALVAGKFPPEKSLKGMLQGENFVVSLPV